MDSAALLDFLLYQLPEDKYEAIRGLGPIPRPWPSCEAERRWNAWEISLRNHLVLYRAPRLHWDEHRYLQPEGPEVFESLDSQVSEALQRHHPLATERYLFELRWARIEDLEADYAFDFNRLVLYRLKLLLLEAHRAPDKARGREQLARFVQTHLNQGKVAEFVHAGTQTR